MWRSVFKMLQFQLIETTFLVCCGGVFGVVNSGLV